jgi:hypothetical protein
LQRSMGFLLRCFITLLNLMDDVSR